MQCWRKLLLLCGIYSAFPVINGFDFNRTSLYTYKLCGRFDREPRSSDAPLPRLFYGSLFGGEFEVLEIVLHEMSGLVHKVVLLESNLTAMGNIKPLRWAEESHLWPPLQKYKDLIVNVSYLEPPGTEHLAYMEGYRGAGLQREKSQRDMLTAAWTVAGFTERDIAIVADVDEVASREFYHFLKYCQWEEGTPSDPAFCSTKPKVRALISFFESYFDCSQAQWYWHPDAISGHCMLGSNISKRWSGQDVRVAEPGWTAAGINGWHLHNFFSAEQMQWKYRIYGHPKELTLEEFQSLREERCQRSEHGVPFLTNVTLADLPLLVQQQPLSFRQFMRRPQDFGLNV